MTVAERLTSVEKVDLSWESLTVAEKVWSWLRKFDCGWENLTSVEKVNLSWWSLSIHITCTLKESQTSKMLTFSSENSFLSELKQKTHKKLLVFCRQSDIMTAQYTQCIEVLTDTRSETWQECWHWSLFQYDNQFKVLKVKTKSTIPTRSREWIVIS